MPIYPNPKVFKKIKRSFLALALALTTFFLLLPNLAKAWEISSFNDDIKIGQDSNMVVAETIVADYTSDPHHGLLRKIPVIYHDQRGAEFSLDLEIQSITDEQGKAWPYQSYMEGQNIVFKIGDANILLSKPATFRITYLLTGALTYFADHDELYWNVTGNEWPVAIKHADAKVSLPQEVNLQKLQATCFSGPVGTSTSNCSKKIKNNLITFETSSALNSGAGLTIVAGFPKGIVTEIPRRYVTTRNANRIQNAGRPALPAGFNYFFFLLPLAVFAFLFYQWYTRGRDPKSDHTTIMPFYKPPDDLSPGEVGTIVDEKVDMQDITSTIIDLAVRGYLQIIEHKDKILVFDNTDYELKSLKDFTNDQKLKEHEKLMLLRIFARGDKVFLSELKATFYREIQPVKDSIYNGVVAKGYFAKNPDVVRKAYKTFGAGTIMAAFLGFFYITVLPLLPFLAIIISGVLISAFGQVMPAKTKKGTETYYKILGLKEYIKTAEKDRLKFQEKENVFEKLLPYAMVLGVAEKWTKTFEGIYQTPPNWYTSTDPNFMNNFTTLYLLDRLNHATNSMNTAFASSPHSAAGGGSGFGGGFSGGGFGGGGGGSW